MTTSLKYKNPAVKVYNGYGHTNDLFVYGHVFEEKPEPRRHYKQNILTNIIHLVKLFLVRPLSKANVQLKWGDQVFHGTTESDGFFKFEWKSDTEVSAGWHPVVVHFLSDNGSIAATGEGKIFIPHSTQYAFVSDIDDTVMISHSATIFRRLRVLFTKNPRTRKSFDDIVEHYDLLAIAHTKPDLLNPFFYVSSSEWNLYDDLEEFFKHNRLPQGVFLLNQIKRWYQLFKTGKTKHHGKFVRVARILNAFPKQKFVLFGDNSQSDHEIYTSVANKYPEKIYAVYIRNIKPANASLTKQHLNNIQNKGIHTCLFDDNTEAIAHSKTIGLVVPPSSTHFNG